jgi:hypothetical protein
MALLRLRPRGLLGAAEPQVPGPSGGRAHVLYQNTGRQLTTWHVKGKVVGRWRWRVVLESEQIAASRVRCELVES